MVYKVHEKGYQTRSKVFSSVLGKHQWFWRMSPKIRNLRMKLGKIYNKCNFFISFLQREKTIYKEQNVILYTSSQICMDHLQQGLICIPQNFLYWKDYGQKIYIVKFFIWSIEKHLFHFITSEHRDTEGDTSKGLDRYFFLFLLFETVCCLLDK